MENKVILCHITAVENVEDIKANGLKSRNGIVYLFKPAKLKCYKNTNRSFIDSVEKKIAIDCIFRNKYAIFYVTVDKANLRPDYCGEYGSEYFFQHIGDIEEVRYGGIHSINYTDSLIERTMNGDFNSSIVTDNIHKEIA